MLERKVIYLVSHPIQYFSPQFKEMVQSGINLEVWYCSDNGVTAYHDPDFDREIKWDIPLLEGYPYRFFKNIGKGLGKNKSFFSLINFGMVKAIFQLPKESMVVVHGWAYFTHWLSMILLKIRGITVFVKGDSNILNEEQVTGLKAGIKRVALGFLFKNLASGALVIGELNRKFYLRYGMLDDQLHFAPMAVDGKRFKPSITSYKAKYLSRYGWDEGSVVILFVGKLTSGKNIQELIQAVSIAANQRIKLLLVGDGPSRFVIEKSVNDAGLKEQVRITGFVNQHEVPQFYQISDIVVLPSKREAWGLSINEAMMVGKPVIVSDKVGCGPDLVRHEKNGYIYELGNVEELSNYLSTFCELSIDKREMMGRKSLEIIQDYTYQRHIRAVKNLMAS